MAEAIFEAEVQIRARLDQFDRDLNKLERDVNAHVRDVERNLQRTATSTESFFKKALGAVSAGLIVRELAQLASASIRFGSEINDAAVRLGVGSEKLQEFRFAAIQAGASVGDLESGLARLSRAMAEARAGNQSAVDAFREINRILGRDILANGAGVEQVFRDLATVMERVKDPAEQLRITFELIGRNPKLLQLLKEGTAGFDDLTRAARESNAVLSDEQVKALDKAGDAWDAFKLRVQVAAAGVVAGTIDLFNRFDEFGKRLDQQAAANEAAARRARGILSDQEIGRRGGIDLLSGSISGQSGVLRPGPIATGRTGPLSGPGGTPAETESERDERIRKQIAAEEKLIKERIENEKRIAQLEQSTAQQRRRALEQIEDLERGMLETRGEYIQAAELELQSIRDRINEMEELTQAEKDRALASVEAAAPEIRRQAREAEAEFERSRSKIAQIAEDLSEGMADAFGDWLREGERSFEALGKAFTESVAEVIIRQLSEIAAKMALIGLVKLGAAIGIPGASGIPLPKFASGGIVRKPTLGVFGESGPEAVVPLDQYNAMRGSGTSVQVFTSEPTATRTHRTADGEVVRIAVGREFVADLERGGPMSKAIERRYGGKRVGV